MSQPTDEIHTTRKLVWAPDGVLTRIQQQVQPKVSLPRNATTAATAAFVFTWPPTFILFTAATLAAPSVTGEASVVRVAFWALQFAILIAVGAAVATVVRALRQRADAADGNTSIWGTLGRVAAQAVLTGVFAWAVLALQGLSIGRIVSLAVMLIVVLNVLPVIVARLLHRRREASRLIDA
jgi:hypothetical protein